MALAIKLINSMNPVIKKAIALTILWVLPLAIAAKGQMHVADSVPVVNPPKKIASKKPSPQEFNVLLREFLGTDAVDISKDTVDPKLTEFFSNDTSNVLYGRLKIKEKASEGAILVSPVAIGAQQIVVVAARIAYKHFLAKTLQAEYIQIVFSKTGKFVEVRKGVATNQDL